MDKKEKKRIIVCIILALTILVIFILLQINKQKENEEVNEYGTLSYKGTETEYGDKGNLSYYTSTGSKEDVDDIPKDITNAVFLYNESVLAKNGLDTYGINSLQEYLLRYLNYYLGEGVYKVTVMEESYKEDQNYPEFSVKEEETGYIIKCIYKRADQRYSFKCDEINE